MADSKIPTWMKVTLLGTLVLVIAAIFIPAALRTTAAGMRGDLDPQVIAAREHADKVEENKAKALSTITSLKAQNTKLEKILKSEGSDILPDFRNLPPCTLEDGSEQSVCIWDGRKQGNGIGAIVINIDHGSISFYPQTNGWQVNG